MGGLGLVDWYITDLFHFRHEVSALRFEHKILTMCGWRLFAFVNVYVCMYVNFSGSEKEKVET